jgi:hypothetical protein
MDINNEKMLRLVKRVTRLCEQAIAHLKVAVECSKDCEPLLDRLEELGAPESYLKDFRAAMAAVKAIDQQIKAG